MQDFLIHPNLNVNEKGHLTVSGQDCTDLATQYGTPLYLLDEQLVRANCRAYVETVRECFPEGSMPLLASKALSFTGIYKIAASEGMGTDLVSSGELFTAKKAGFPLEKAFFHGNNKTDSDIAFAMDCGVGYFIVDNMHELHAVNKEAESRGMKQKILLRLTPGIDPHTHKAITTGTVDSKFGSVIENGQAEVTALICVASIAMSARRCLKSIPLCRRAKSCCVLLRKCRQSTAIPPNTATSAAASVQDTCPVIRSPIMRHTSAPWRLKSKKSAMLC